MNQRLVVSAHAIVPVRVACRVQVHASYLADSVIVSLRGAILHLFAFDQRELGQPAFVSDVFRVCQSVAGVTAVDIDEFRYRDQASEFLADVLMSQSHELLQLASADLDLRPQFTSL
jgi:phage-related baseplate assembly protein